MRRFFLFAAVVLTFVAASCTREELPVAQPVAEEQEAPEEQSAAGQAEVAVRSAVTQTFETTGQKLYGIDFTKIREFIAALADAPADLFHTPAIRDGIRGMLLSILPGYLEGGIELPLQFSNLNGTVSSFGSVALLWQEFASQEDGAGIGIKGRVDDYIELDAEDGTVYLINFIADAGKGNLELLGNYSNKSFELSITEVFVTPEGELIDFESIFEISLEASEENVDLAPVYKYLGYAYDCDYAAEIYVGGTTANTSCAYNELTRSIDTRLEICQSEEMGNLLEISSSISWDGAPSLLRKIQNRTVVDLMEGTVAMDVDIKDLHALNGLLATVLLMQEPGYPKYFCENSICSKWPECCALSIDLMGVTLGEFAIGTRKVHEDNPDFNLYVPTLVLRTDLYDMTMEEILDLLIALIQNM